MGHITPPIKILFTGIGGVLSQVRPNMLAFVGALKARHGLKVTPTSSET